jgi:hypothetical protein
MLRGLHLMGAFNYLLLQVGATVMGLVSLVFAMVTLNTAFAGIAALFIIAAIILVAVQMLTPER